MKKYLYWMFFSAVLGLAGCGQSGPLYFPQNDTTQSEAPTK